MKKKNKSIPPLEEEGGEALSFEELALLRKEGERRREEGELAPYDTSDRAHLRRYMKKNPILAAAVIVILVALAGLLIFGADAFLIPSMVGIVILLTAFKGKIEEVRHE